MIRTRHIFKNVKKLMRYFLFLKDFYLILQDVNSFVKTCISVYRFVFIASSLVI